MREGASSLPLDFLTMDEDQTPLEALLVEIRDGIAESNVKLDRILAVFDGVEQMVASNGAMKALGKVKL